MVLEGCEIIYTLMLCYIKVFVILKFAIVMFTCII